MGPFHLGIEQLLLINLFIYVYFVSASRQWQAQLQGDPNHKRQEREREREREESQLNSSCQKLDYCTGETLGDQREEHKGKTEREAMKDSFSTR